MICWKKIYGLAVFLMVVSLSGYAQKTTRGIVMDSSSLKTLPGVHVVVKNKNQGTVTNSIGVFLLKTLPTDTLVLSFVGYNTLELPLLFEEDDILIRLSERIQILKEVTITGNRLYESPIVREPRNQPHKMSVSDAFSSPWTYFSKGEKEKRKVVKLINENDRIKTYIEVINDQELREEIMDAHQITETDYYNTLAKFNQQSRDVLYSTDPYAIMTSLKYYFDRIYKP